MSWYIFNIQLYIPFPEDTILDLLSILLANSVYLLRKRLIYIRKKTHKPNVLRFWVEGVISYMLAQFSFLWEFFNEVKSHCHELNMYVNTRRLNIYISTKGMQWKGNKRVSSWKLMRLRWTWLTHSCILVKLSESLPHNVALTNSEIKRIDLRELQMWRWLRYNVQNIKTGTARFFLRNIFYKDIGETSY